MIFSRILKVILISFVAFVCIVPLTIIGVAIGVPAIREWQNQHLITVIEDGQYRFDNTRQLTGSYKQRNFFYWSPKQLSEVKQFYNDLTTSSFVLVDDPNASWLITALKDSKIIEYPTRNVKQLPTDFCDYQEVFACVSVVLFDASQSNLSIVLDSLYSLSINEKQSFPTSGTLIVFSYFIPDFS